MKISQKRRRTGFITLRRFMFVLGLLVLLLLVGFFFFFVFDINMECDKAKNLCIISKKNIFEPNPIPLRRFDISSIVDISVATRNAEDGKMIYDILLNCGPYKGKVFIDYGFNTKIKANTVQMKLVKFINTPAKTLNITKHCYFNNYFCF